MSLIVNIRNKENLSPFYPTLPWVYVIKVKQSRYRLGVAERVPGS